MEKERKMQPIVKKFSSFKDADDEYWASTTEEERLNALIDLRKIFINKSEKEIKIQKVVTKRSIYEEAG